MGMSNEIKGYVKVEAIIAGAFNFFIHGMITALAYHKADTVAMDLGSIATDLMPSCLLIFIITALFSRSSIRQSKREGILETRSRVMRFFNRLLRYPVLFGMVTGIAAAIILIALIMLISALFGIQAIPFGVFVALKCVLCAVLGGGAMMLELHAGMCKSD